MLWETNVRFEFLRPSIKHFWFSFISSNMLFQKPKKYYYTFRSICRRKWNRESLSFSESKSSEIDDFDRKLRTNEVRATQSELSRTEPERKSRRFSSSFGIPHTFQVTFSTNSCRTRGTWEMSETFSEFSLFHDNEVSLRNFRENWQTIRTSFPSKNEKNFFIVNIQVFTWFFCDFSTLISVALFCLRGVGLDPVTDP